MSETLGIGLWRGPGQQIADDLTPGMPPQPSEGREGPPFARPMLEWEKLLETIEKLGRETAKLGFDIVTGNATAQTSSQGVAVVGLYQVAAGIEAKLHRLVGNAVVPASGVAYTAAVPFQANAAYVQVYAAEVPDQAAALSNAGLLDFRPTVAQAQLFPLLIKDNAPQASAVRGPMWFVAYVNAGSTLGNTSVTFRYQISLRREAGIA